MSSNAVNRPANAVVRNITAVGGVAALDVSGMNGLVFRCALTGTDIRLAFEASIDSTDGANGTWAAVPCFRFANPALIADTGVLTAAVLAPLAFAAPTTSWTYFRARVVSGTFTSCAISFAPSQEPSLLSALACMVGAQAVNTAISPLNNPVLLGARASLTNFTAQLDTTLAAVAADGAGKLVVNPYTTNELAWQYFAAADGTPITTATTTTLRAAVATFRNYVTGIQLINVGATATEVVLQDTTATPAVMWRAFLPASMTVARDVQFQVPLRTNGSGTNSGVVLRTVTAGCAVHVSAQGFAGY